MAAANQNVEASPVERLLEPAKYLGTTYVRVDDLRLRRVLSNHRLAICLQSMAVVLYACDDPKTLLMKSDR